MLELADLGRRIVICGPSNAGKSTLAAALGRKLGVPAVHLDELCHLPGTSYQPRPVVEFHRLHELAVAGEEWVIEGNYFGLMPQRLARATGIILLGSEPWRGLFRYLRRTLFESGRVGVAEGTVDRLSWEMIRLIIVQQPRKRARDVAILAAGGLPFVQLASMRDLNKLYRSWHLAR